MGFDMQQQIYRAYRMGLDSCNTQTLQADNSCPGYLVELSGVMVNVYLMSTEYSKWYYYSLPVIQSAIRHLHGIKHTLLAIKQGMLLCHVCGVVKHTR